MNQHKCLLAPCKNLVGDRWPICGAHFRVLPERYLDDLFHSYAPGMTRESAPPGLGTALAKAEAWLLTEFSQVVREKWDPGKWERLVQWVRSRDEARARLRAATPDPGPDDPQNTFRHLRLVP